MVSPTGAPLILLTPAQIKPTSPATSLFFSNLLGVKTPNFSTKWTLLFEENLILSPRFI